MNSSLEYLEKCAGETGFQLSTLEKVVRLGEVAADIILTQSYLKRSERSDPGRRTEARRRADSARTDTTDCPPEVRIRPHGGKDGADAGRTGPSIGSAIGAERPGGISSQPGTEERRRSPTRCASFPIPRPGLLVWVSAADFRASSRPAKCVASSSLPRFLCRLPRWESCML
jgi:hypothetical protein